ncbi:hypothetical protein [Cylindrospermopsis curvispora]|uniref:Uncharacterized protein n=1 Tax=Cylindrospermopsis curvispora GIHE-G1 TaxID=2666332 RepID=A0A7H0F5W3_9CYAN|nr:hypothetical protein [Cylindrospermopsis curvispora]QNP31429.1 hypothetical protein IAR63_17730 [Cylindrospermopsis curvispora GIHE-G1]
MIGFAGDREALPAGDRTSDSSQGKTVNLLLGMGDGICGSSHLTIFSREISQPVIGNR